MLNANIQIYLEKKVFLDDERGEIILKKVDV